MITSGHGAFLLRMPGGLSISNAIAILSRHKLVEIDTYKRWVISSGFWPSLPGSLTAIWRFVFHREDVFYFLHKVMGELLFATQPGAEDRGSNPTRRYMEVSSEVLSQQPALYAL